MAFIDQNGVILLAWKKFYSSKTYKLLVWLGRKIRKIISKLNGRVIFCLPKLIFGLDKNYIYWIWTSKFFEMTTGLAREQAL